MPVVEMPMNRTKGSQVKKFYLGKYSLKCMKILYQRAKNRGSIFPGSWQMTDAHHKKRRRRIYLEFFLAELWRSAFPDKPQPDYLGVDFWIKASRLSMVLNGVPFLCLADLRNRLRGAQTPAARRAGNNLTHQSAQPEQEDVINTTQRSEWLKSLHVLVRKYDDQSKEKMRLGQARDLYDEFRKALFEAECSGACNADEAVLARWLIWMMDQKRFRHMRLSTFRGYVSAVSNRVLPLPEGRSIIQIGTKGWMQAVYDLATNEDYMPSSRRTAITHMRVLNEYLHSQKLAPKVDFSDYKYRVPRTTAECEVIFPHEVDDLIAKAPEENMKVALILAFYCGLRCEEVCYLTVDAALDEYRLLIGRSKLPSSRRTFPFGLFVPEPHMEFLREIIRKRLDDDVPWLVCDEEDEPVPTWKLSKQVGRFLSAKNARVKKMHGLRHGFASWQLVRYFMLIDKQFRRDARMGGFHLELDGRHLWFGDSMLADFAESLGGASWYYSFKDDGRCIGNATDMILISKLMGHASRFTTLENYTNTLGWITRYYLQRREARLIGRNCPKVISRI
jgi:integrase